MELFVYVILLLNRHIVAIFTSLLWQKVWQIAYPHHIINWNKKLIILFHMIVHVISSKGFNSLQPYFGGIELTDCPIPKI